MPDRDAIDERLSAVRTKRDDQEAKATAARDSLLRLASGITPLGEIDPRQVRAAADDWADAVARYQELCERVQELRELR